MTERFYTLQFPKDELYTRAVWKVWGLVAVHRCYAEGGRDCYAKL
jgi:hypothetical protein